MSNAVVVAGIIGATAIMVSVIAALTLILLYHDGSSEGQIVTALVGLPTILISAMGPIISHYLTMRENNNKPTP